MLEKPLSKTADISEFCLKTLNERGLVPGPLETESSFFLRVMQSKNVNLSTERKDGAVKAFDFSIDWIPIEYSNKNLFFFEAGALFSDEKKARIQLSKKFLKKKSFFVDKSELLSHEAVHAMRLQFKENRFEEIFAYLTSKSKWRREFGPLIKTTKESKFFFFSLCGCSLASLMHPVFSCVSFAFLSAFVFRLWKDQKILRKCIKNLSAFVSHNPIHLALRLTDLEVLTFAKSSQSEIADYMNKQVSIRWKMLKDAYAI